jgi:hypothetical protein
MRPFGFLARLRLDKTSNLFALLAAETLLLWIVELKSSLTFVDYGFGDGGLNLTVQYLLGLGLRPGSDFGWNYGLLALLVGRFWFALLGATPIAVTVLALTCRLVIVWSIARIAARYSLGLPALAFIAVALPYVAGVLPAMSIAHHLEAALLSIGLAEHASGRRDSALALATTACFARPALGYVYGLLLLLFILADLYLRNRLDAGEIVRSLLPAAVTGLLLISILAQVYGARSVAVTIFPLNGMAAYRACNFGFFAQGRYFWHPPGANWRWYVGNTAGVWLLGSIWLLGNAVFSGWRMFSTREASTQDEMILTCGLLHVAFVTLMFGPSGSWMYYTLVWLIGIGSTGGRKTSLAAYALTILTFATLLSYRASLPATISFWRNSTYGPDTAGLWASAEERSEWDQAERIAQGRRAALLYERGAGGLLLAGFEKPVALLLMPGCPTSSEVGRQAQQLKDASVIAVWFDYNERYSALNNFPEIRRALDGTRRVYHGMYFDVYVRDPS